MRVILKKRLRDMTDNEIWLLRWYQDNERLGYTVSYNLQTGEYEVISGQAEKKTTKR